jgi:uncharacterized membrane protein (UPF0182 family)
MQNEYQYIPIDEEKEQLKAWLRWFIGSFGDLNELPVEFQQHLRIPESPPKSVSYEE